MVHELNMDEKWIKLNCPTCSKKYGTPIEFTISVHLDDYLESRWKQYWQFWDFHEECEFGPLNLLLVDIARIQEEDCELLTKFYAEEGATFSSVREKYLTYRRSKVMTVSKRSQDEVDSLKKLFNPTQVKLSAN